MGAGIFKPITAILISSETKIWVPTIGTKFRLMGGYLTMTVAAGNIVLKDGVGGSTVFIIPCTAVGVAIALDLEDGILSAAADNALTATGPALCVLNGTIWGTEE